MTDLTEAFEMHGVWASKETEKGVWVKASEVRGGVMVSVAFSDALLTARQARYLARKLHRLATRIEKREAGEE